MILALLLWACTATVQTLISLDAHQPPPELAQVFAGENPAEVYADALNRRTLGDNAGAIERLSWLATQGHGGNEALRLDSLAQLGLTFELSEDRETAIGVYDLLLSSTEDPLRQRDVGFRRALCLEELGRYEEAIAQYTSLQQVQDLDRHDRYTYDIALGVAYLQGGKTRKGLQLLNSSLEATTEADGIPWMVAKGWYNLAKYNFDQAAALRLDNARKAPKDLRERAGLILDGEAYIVKVVEQEQPEWILRSLRDLGDAYMGLARDLLASPPPPGLSAEQQLIYGQELRNRCATLYRKAWEAYDNGLTVSGRIGGPAPLIAELQASKAAVPIP